MKKLRSVILMIIIMIAFGCNRKESTPSNRFSEENISKIVISNNDKTQKDITDPVDIKNIINTLNQITFFEFEQESTDKPFYRISMLNISDTVINTVSILGQKIYYEGNWHGIDMDIVNKIDTNYKVLKYTEESITNDLELERRKSMRNEMATKDVIIGTWITFKGDSISFDEMYLRQGEQKFRYVINEVGDKRLAISIYGLKGFLIKDRQLFDMDIVLDHTNNNIQIMKIVNQIGSSDLVFKYNMVFKDKDDNMLGNFDSEFFSKDVFLNYNKNL